MSAVSADGLGRATGALLLAGVMLAVLAEALSSTVLSLGRADMVGDLHATPDEFAWLDISYTAAKLFGFIGAGWLIAQVPIRHVLLVATLALGGACAVSVLTTRPDLLVLLRGVQGFSGALLLVASQVLIFLSFARKIQPVMQAFFAMGAVVAPATVAPAFEGWLLDSLSWTWIFFSVVPLSLGAAGLLLVTNGPDPDVSARRPFDGVGFCLLAIALVCLTYGLTLGNRWNWLDSERIGWLGLVAIVCLLAFGGSQWIAQNRHAIDPSPFRSPDFTFAFIVSFVAGAALFGSAYLIPTFALSVLAFTPTDAGLLLLPSSILFAFALLLAATVIQVFHAPPFATVPVGIFLVMTAMYLLSGSAGASGADDLMPALLLRGLGLGFLFLSITLIAFDALPTRALATGVGLFSAGRQLGGLMGVAGLQTLVDHNVANNVAVLASHLVAGLPSVMARIEANTAALAMAGLEAGAARNAASGGLFRAMTGQATVIAFDTAFLAVALLFVVAAPILIVVKVGTAKLARRHSDRPGTTPMALP
jgi:DHA2 family multidrug resistance protein